LVELFHAYLFWLDSKLGQFFPKSRNAKGFVGHVVQLLHDVSRGVFVGADNPFQKRNTASG
jgi:hypothetical protein